MDREEDVSHLAEAQTVRTPRSKEWIMTALLQLMEHTGYSDISILQIADKAGVVRQTFYRNYKDKDEVLFASITELFEQFFGDFGKESLWSERLFIRLFDKWKHRMPPALLNNITNKDRKVRQILYRSLSFCLDRMIAEAAGEETGEGLSECRYYARASLSSVIHVMLIDWTLSGFRLPPEEMGAICFKLTASMRDELGRFSGDRGF